jgi:hypothetical protein
MLTGAHYRARKTRDACWIPENVDGLSSSRSNSGARWIRWSASMEWHGMWLIFLRSLLTSTLVKQDLAHRKYHLCLIHGVSFESSSPHRLLWSHQGDVQSKLAFLPYPTTYSGLGDLSLSINIVKTSKLLVSQPQVAI